MRPVAARFPTTQGFGSMPTAGVAPSNQPGTVGWYVRLYGNYQPFGHAGADIGCPIGTPVRAMKAGTVVWADWGSNLPGDDSWGARGYFRRWAFYKSFPGILTVIHHPQIGPHVYTAYAHLSDNDQAPAGTYVEERQVIGLSGNTGGVDPHLHVELLVDPTYSTGNGLIYGRIDPSKFYGSAAVGPLGATSTPIEEDDMFTDQDRADIARVKQLLLSFQDALTDPVTGYIGHAALAILRSGSGTQYVKGPEEKTIYEYEDGKLRGLDFDEWKIAHGAGNRAIILPQADIDKMKEKP